MSVFSIEWKKKVFALLFIIVTILFSIGYAKAPFYHKRADSHYLTRSNFIDGTNSPGNSFNTKWLPTIPQKRKDKFEFLKGAGSIKANNVKPQSYKLTIHVKEDSQIIVNTAYFPGWMYSVDNKKTNVNNHDGRILIKIPSGIHKVELIFTDTLVRIISYVYFFTSLLLLLFLGRKSITGIIRK